MNNDDMKYYYKIKLYHNDFLILSLHLENKVKELIKTMLELRKVRFYSSKKQEITKAIETYILDIRSLRNFLNQLNNAQPTEN